VSEGGRFLGSVEMLRNPIADRPEFEEMLRQAGVPAGPLDLSQPEQAARVRAALRAMADSHMDSIEQDRRVTYPPGTTFSRIEPEEIVIGGLPGLAYGFAGLQADGRAVERWLTYIVHDGAALYFFTAFHAPDAPGSFPSDAELLPFEPYLRHILAGLRLPSDGNPAAGGGV
jgi:hypothetical protein